MNIRILLLNLPLNHVKLTVIIAINVNQQQKVLALHALKDTVIQIIPVQYVMRENIKLIMIQQAHVLIAMQDTGAVQEVIPLHKMHVQQDIIAPEAADCVLKILQQIAKLNPQLQIPV